MERKKNWLVIVNEECSIYGGDIMVCESKNQAVNIASFVARVLYKSGQRESHIFVVNRMKKDAVSNVVDKEDLEYNVIYHYSVQYVASLGLKMLMLYEGFAMNQKKIASQWIGEEGE